MWELLLSAPPAGLHDFLWRPAVSYGLIRGHGSYVIQGITSGFRRVDPGAASKYQPANLLSPTGCRISGTLIQVFCLFPREPYLIRRIECSGSKSSSSYSH